MLKLLINTFVQRFTKYGRYLDLVAGLAVIGMGAYWSSWLMIGVGCFSLLAFAFDLNGWIQRKSQGMAQAHVRRRMAARR